MSLEKEIQQRAEEIKKQEYGKRSWETLSTAEIERIHNRAGRDVQERRRRAGR